MPGGREEPPVNPVEERCYQIPTVHRLSRRSLAEEEETSRRRTLEDREPGAGPEVAGGQFVRLLGSRGQKNTLASQKVSAARLFASPRLSSPTLAVRARQTGWQCGPRLERPSSTSTSRRLFNHSRTSVLAPEALATSRHCSDLVTEGQAPDRGTAHARTRQAVHADTACTHYRASGLPSAHRRGRAQS